MFLDADDFRLYDNAFILRRRVLFEDGFPDGEPEAATGRKGLKSWARPPRDERHGPTLVLDCQSPDKHAA